MAAAAAVAVLVGLSWGSGGPGRALAAGGLGLQPREGGWCGRHPGCEGGCATLANPKPGITSEINKAFAFKASRNNGGRVPDGCLVTLPEIRWRRPVRHGILCRLGRTTASRVAFVLMALTTRWSRHARTSGGLAVTYRGMHGVRRCCYPPASSALVPDCKAD